MQWGVSVRTQQSQRIYAVAHSLAFRGYGWEDLVVKLGLREKEARKIVWDRTRQGQPTEATRVVFL